MQDRKYCWVDGGGVECGAEGGGVGGEVESTAIPHADNAETLERHQEEATVSHGRR